MGYIWAVLAAIQPAFQTAVDASDPAIRSLLKTPASLADLGLAVLTVYALRDTPRWAAIAATLVLIVPAVFYVSAWWGQYESIYVLWALGGVIAALHGRNGVAAVLVAVALMTKPQAVAFIVPFAAWFWASGYARGGTRGGLVEIARTGLIGLAVIVVLWLPFVPAGGPLAYLDNLGIYQNEIFHILSLRAWNAWWLVQEAVAGGSFITDDVAFLGPLTLRHIGYLITALFQVLIGVAIVRDPRPRTLILGLVASTLVIFTFMTQMHERYSFAALIFVLLLIADVRLRWLALGLAVVVTLNLVAAVPPTAEVGATLPIAGPLGIVGSVAMIGFTLFAIIVLDRRRRDYRVEAGPASESV
jgi:hypothetical protein